MDVRIIELMASFVPACGDRYITAMSIDDRRAGR
jgi:hypothetical protein